MRANTVALLSVVTAAAAISILADSCAAQSSEDNATGIIDELLSSGNDSNDTTVSNETTQDSVKETSDENTVTPDSTPTSNEGNSDTSNNNTPSDNNDTTNDNDKSDTIKVSSSNDNNEQSTDKHTSQDKPTNGNNNDGGEDDEHNNPDTTARATTSSPPATSTKRSVRLTTVTELDESTTSFIPLPKSLSTRTSKTVVKSGTRSFTSTIVETLDESSHIVAGVTVIDGSSMYYTYNVDVVTVGGGEDDSDDISGATSKQQQNLLRIGGGSAAVSTWISAVAAMGIAAYNYI